MASPSSSLSSHSIAGKILVVDDEWINHRVMEEVLGNLGYEVYHAEDGLEGLKYCSEVDFDAILLDLMMPQMNGKEVCRKLRANAATEHLPIIMVTSQSDREDRLEALEAGANDFLPKPVDHQDLIVRVRNAVHLKHLNDDVRESYRQLKEAERMREDMTAMMVHDMRNPLIGIIGNLELVQFEGQLQGMEAECLEQAHRCSNDLVSMVNSLLDVTRLESGNMPLALATNELDDIVETALDALGSKIRNVNVVRNLDRSLLTKCDAGVIARVIGNLVSNAADFVPETSGRIEIRASEAEGFVKLSVIDNGPGISQEDQERIFEKFSQSRTSRRNARPSAGLGLAFCKMAVESHGGEIQLESEAGKGASFHVLLPMGIEEEAVEEEALVQAA